MAVKYRYPYCGGGDFDIRLHDLAGLVDQLHLFVGIAVVAEGIDLRQTVESDAMGVNLGIGGTDVEHVHHLFVQFFDGLFSAGRDRLVGGDHDAFDGSVIVQRLERHHQLDCGAGGVGDDTFLAKA